MEQDPTTSDYRLPKSLVPTSYNLSLKLDPDENKYNGTVIISFDIEDENTTARNIFLHVDSDFVYIESTVLNDLILCPTYRIKTAHIIQIDCPTDISGKVNHLYVEFMAKFSQDGYRLVKKTYTDQGKAQSLVVSNFKPAYARRAFPCMDEPGLKANFSVQLTYPNKYIALSNSPVVEENTEDGLKTTKFQDTPRISTYLVSSVVSELQTAHTNINGDSDFKIFTRVDVENLTQTIISYHGKVLDELGDYTGILYQDVGDTECYQVALPEYYSDTGGFGVFTYRELDILDEKDHTTTRVTQDILTSMVHKLSHEWYGGSISTKWWSDVWANEAVATYLKYVISNKVNTDFDLFYQFVMEVVRKAFHEDALPSAQSLSSNEDDVQTLEDIRDELDDYSYRKGASVLHMISYILGGQNKFRDSLRDHLARRYRGIDIFTEMIYSVSERLFSQSDLEWLENLLSSKLLDSYDDIKAKALALAYVNNYWSEQYRSQVTEIFRGPTTSSEPSTSAGTPASDGTTDVIITTTDSGHKLRLSVFVIAIACLSNVMSSLVLAWTM